MFVLGLKLTGDLFIALVLSLLVVHKEKKRLAV